MIGGTLEAEYQRTAELLVDISDQQGIYFALYFLIDSGYSVDDMRRIADIAKDIPGARKVDSEKSHV